MNKVFILLILIFSALNLMASADQSEVQSKTNQQFQVYDLYIDGKNESVSAWQVELKFDPKTIKIIGIEGSSEKGWQKAPYYDNKGFKQGRLIVAAFKTGKEYTLVQRKRIARFHITTTSDNNTIQTQLIDAANLSGARIQPQIELVKAGV